MSPTPAASLARHPLLSPSQTVDVRVCIPLLGRNHSCLFAFHLDFEVSAHSFTDLSLDCLCQALYGALGAGGELGRARALGGEGDQAPGVKAS